MERIGEGQVRGKCCRCRAYLKILKNIKQQFKKL